MISNAILFAGSSFPEIAYFFTRAGVDKYEYGRVSGEEFFEFLMFYEMTPPHNQVIKPDENLILSKIHKVLVTEFATLLNFLKDNHRICAEVFDKTVMLVAKLFVEDLQNAVFRLLSRRLNERLEQYARISSYQPNGPVLSIGCGLNGLIQVEASGRRGNILVDNHPLTAEILRTYIRLKERKDVVVCERDVREFNLGSGSFGLLNSEIFVHMFNVQEIEMILRGLYGAMQINGTFYLKEPTSGCCTSTSQTGETMVKVLQDLFPYVYRRTCEFVKPGDPTQTGDGIEIVGSATRLV